MPIYLNSVNGLTEQRNRAFNLGADARINGQPMDDNPYTNPNDMPYRWWREGWKDVDKHWGEYNVFAPPLCIVEVPQESSKSVIRARGRNRGQDLYFNDI